MDICPYHYTR